MARTYKHSDSFYMKQYIKYKNQAKINIFNNFESFKSKYQFAEKQGQTNITKNFVYETNYEISYDTYKAERDMMKRIGKKVPKKELLDMTTQEFAEKYNSEIQHVYRSYIRQGKSATEAQDLISIYFFGSL